MSIDEKRQANSATHAPAAPFSSQRDTPFGRYFCLRRGAHFYALTRTCMAPPLPKFSHGRQRTHIRTPSAWQNVENSSQQICRPKNSRYIIPHTRGTRVYMYGTASGGRVSAPHAKVPGILLSSWLWPVVAPPRRSGALLGNRIPCPSARQFDRTAAASGKFTGLGSMAARGGFFTALIYTRGPTERAARRLEERERKATEEPQTDPRGPTSLSSRVPL